MKDIRILPVNERLAPLITREDGYLVARIPNNKETLLEPTFYNTLSSFLIKNCSCGIPECGKFSSYPVINWADRLSSLHFIAFNTKFEDKDCQVQVIQSSDLSALTLISVFSGWFSQNQNYIGCYLKFTPKFASSFPFYFKDLLPFSSDSDNLDSNRLKRAFSFYSTKDISAKFNFRLLLSDSNSTAKEVAKREIRNHGKSSNSSEGLETANDWDENFLTVFPFSSDKELIDSYSFISYCIFIPLFCFFIFFWKLFHTLFMKFIRFLGLIESRD